VVAHNDGSVFQGVIRCVTARAGTGTGPYTMLYYVIYRALLAAYRLMYTVYAHYTYRNASFRDAALPAQPLPAKT
jgi:hypothetical protein